MRFFWALLVLLACGAHPAHAASCPGWMNVNLPRLQDDQPQPMCQYAGRVLLVVNTASKCGFTPQYEGLEKLHARLKDKGLTVLGFPSGDFGGQELGTSKQIAEFCENTFGVKFPMFAKSKVKGPGANPVFTHLAAASGQAPGWNFHKYLVSRDGSQVLSFDSTIAPDDARLTAALERMLAAPAAKP